MKSNELSPIREFQLGDKVWVVGVGLVPTSGIVVDRNKNGKKIFEYDVSLDPQPTAVNSGSVTHCGLLPARVHKDKISAVREIYGDWANRHHWLGIALQDCIKNWDDPDAIMRRLERFEILCREG